MFACLQEYLAEILANGVPGVDYVDSVPFYHQPPAREEPGESRIVA